MASQNCPKCLSSRVRRGYRPTPFWAKILFRYNLLCDNCNWEFRGWAVPGTVSAKPTKKPKKNPVGKPSDNQVVTNSDSLIADFKNESADSESGSIESTETELP
jgi:hypothetical protein